jgi:hypothetical protein
VLHQHHPWPRAKHSIEYGTDTTRMIRPDC